MNIILRLLGIIACLALIFLLQSTKTSTTEIAVLTDVTEDSLVEPNSGDILKLYGFNDNKWNGGIFRLSNISQVSLNMTVQTYVEDENKWLYNSFERDKEIISFTKSVEEIISKATHESKGKNNSSVYLPIANALNQLNEYRGTTVNQKILIVYSDLMENTDGLSFYKKEDFEKLKTKPEEIQSYFESLASIDSLKDTEVYFIYQPTDTKSDERFRIVAGFYKTLLEDKGATVTISANLNL